MRPQRTKRLEALCKADRRRSPSLRRALFYRPVPRPQDTQIASKLRTKGNGWSLVKLLFWSDGMNVLSSKVEYYRWSAGAVKRNPLVNCSTGVSESRVS